MRGLGSRAVSDPLGVEQDQIRVVTHLDRATLSDPDVLGGERGHSPNALFETDHIALTDVMSEKPGKGAKATWMSTCEIAVTADYGMWPGHDGLDIGFVHGKTQHLEIRTPRHPWPCPPSTTPSALSPGRIHGYSAISAMVMPS